VAEIGRQDRGDQSEHVEDGESEGPEHVLVEAFQRPAEEVQRDHVEQQVHEIRMDQAVAEQAEVFLLAADRRRPEDQRVESSSDCSSR
jgi:hypothetical protein